MPMESEFLVRHWGLLAASVLLVAVALNIAVLLWQRSASGQLRHALSAMQEQRQVAAKAADATDKAEARLDRLRQSLDKVRPSHLQEARDGLQDARALQKIADDKLLVAENQLRRIIHEEFPPVKQHKLRIRYLPSDLRDPRPFSF
jgi:biopolymer transport protein ExbB/TolQ